MEHPPHHASVDAARKLLKPATWPAASTNGQGLIWGACQGSGATPCRVLVSEADSGYMCPPEPESSLQLLAGVGVAACRWQALVYHGACSRMGKRLAGAQARQAAPSPTTASGSGTTASIQASSTDIPEAKPDPKAEARAVAARERNRQEGGFCPSRPGRRRCLAFRSRRY